MDAPESAGNFQIPKSLFFAVGLAIIGFLMTGGFYMGHLQAVIEANNDKWADLKADVLAHRATDEANTRVTDANFAGAIGVIKSTTDRIEAQMKFIIDDRASGHK